MRGIAALAAALACACSFAQAPATRTISDAAGRVVTLPATVNRVADPWPANNAMVLLLGAADKLVATSWQAARQPWFSRLYPRMAAIPQAFNSGGDVNVETLVAAKTEVVLMAYGGTPPRWLSSVESLGIPVVLMPNTSLADLKTTLKMTGEVLGEREARAASEFIRYFDANIRRVSAVSATIPRSQRLKVLHTATAGILAVDGRDTVVDDWINVAGGINAAEVTGNARPVDMEQVVKWNPDVVIVGSAPNGRNRQAILDDPRWREVKAVKTGRVYVNPTGAYLWDRHSAEAALQVLWAAKTLYPERFADIDIETETRAFYSRFFRHELTAAELASILNATAP